ncbi:hypothetical protein RAAC3_TM7C00001G0903 [Candidatus Saccharibacteria bacterium RAAC3_TM7_1]|nr:hypothetical protein RAAC3_TM7C00001G0903 [Candidatus Saccharibacteria bacterium RAAC3_TM7_1]
MNESHKMLKILDDVKWLLVLQLQQQGVKSAEIAKVLGVDAAIISRRVPRNKK